MSSISADTQDYYKSICAKSKCETGRVRNQFRNKPYSLYYILECKPLNSRSFVFKKKKVKLHGGSFKLLTLDMMFTIKLNYPN